MLECAHQVDDAGPFVHIGGKTITVSKPIATGHFGNVCCFATSDIYSLILRFFECFLEWYYYYHPLAIFILSFKKTLWSDLNRHATQGILEREIYISTHQQHAA
jgi:hypothetical protein